MLNHKEFRAKKKVGKKDLNKILALPEEKRKIPKHKRTETDTRKLKQGEGYVKLASLTAWLLENGAWIAQGKLSLKAGICGSGFGYGVISRRNLDVGQSLCIIPKKLVISAKTCGARKEIEESMVIGEVATAIALMYEQSLGAKSRWFPYLDSLPEFESLPYFWDESDKVYLQGTDVEKIVAKYKGLLKEDYESLVLPLVQTYPKKFPSTLFSFENFFKASSLVSSRAFMVDSYHCDSMVPLADLFNHKTAREGAHFESVDACPICGKSEGCEHETAEESDHSEDAAANGESDSNSEHGSESENESESESESGSEKESESDAESEKSESESEEVDDNRAVDEGESENNDKHSEGKPNHEKEARKATDDEIEMVVVKRITKNGEIYNTFGELSNSCLLTKYGFAEKDNPFDTVDMKASLIVGTLLTDTMKTRFAHCARLLTQKVFEVGFNGEVEPELIRALYVCVMPDATYKVWSKESTKAQARKLKAVNITAAMNGSGSGPAISMLILGALEERNKQYTTTLTTDLQMLKESPAFSPTRYALVLRTSERSILQKAMQFYSPTKAIGVTNQATNATTIKPTKTTEATKPTKVTQATEATKTTKPTRATRATSAARAIIPTNATNTTKTKSVKQTLKERLISGDKRAQDAPLMTVIKPKAPKRLVQRFSKYDKKKDALRRKRAARFEIVKARAKLALDYYYKEHAKLTKRRGKKIPFPKQFPLDLRPKGSNKRPLMINYDYTPAPKKLRKKKK